VTDGPAVGEYRPWLVVVIVGPRPALFHRRSDDDGDALQAVDEAVTGIQTTPTVTSNIHVADCLTALRAMPAASVHCCVTSPPYWSLRDYGCVGQLGLEETPQQYVAAMVAVFAEVRRVLREDGVLWLNLGDCYADGGRGGGAKDCKQCTNAGSLDQQPNGRVPGLKPKDLVGIPWRVAFALQDAGWWLRSDCIWSKPNPMPESVRDRPTKSHEYVFLLTKSAKYSYYAAAVMVPYAESSSDRYAYDFGRRNGSGDAVNDRRTVPEGKRDLGAGANLRSVWTISPQPFRGAHFATFPEALAERCVLSGCPEGGIVLDPFAGSGTTGVVALKHGRSFVGVELNPAYAEIAQRRINDVAPLFVLTHRA